ncbi:MAG: hypothetical protein K6E77_09855 [Lachnospiraceae bacterium]|nr:hypothetical protein [Lachnospiraceae bacterium]
MEEMKKREIIEKYSEELGKAGKSGYDTVYEEFKVVCNENGYIGELQSQMWASVVKRVEKSTKD